MTIRSPYPDVAIPEVSLFEFLFGGGFGDHAGTPALIDGGTGATLRYAELGGLVLKVAAALAARRVGAGDVVALFAPNSPLWVAAFHGALRANATVMTANSLSTPSELGHQLRDSGARQLITVSAFLDRASAAAKAAGLADDAVVLLDEAPGYASLRGLLAAAGEPPPLRVGPADPAVLPYSSGTTGLAKGVVLTHRNLVANLRQVDATARISPGTKLLAVLPFFHIYGMTVMMNAGINKRSTVVTMPKFDLPEFLRVISQYRVQRVYIAPPIAVALAKHPAVDRYDLSCVEVIVSGAAPLAAELGHAVAKRLGCVVLQGYGMTELSPVSHTIPDDRPDIDLDSVGVALPNIACKLVDPATGREVGPGGRGELWVKGPNVMARYLNDPEATAATLDADGYLHTGDVATVTEDGVFTIVDRVKELIKYKGYQVPPAELEALLLTHDEIADVAVIGVRDGETEEEVPKAFVVRQPGAALGAEEVIAFVAERVAPYKKVRAVEFLDQIPKSAAGKILRNVLRARQAAAT
ncbi:MAG TPA: AMP-binding protein [Polyangiaceae bacterium]|nr:AMP-binding protein [Polyangiaceae bacterium]